MTLLVWDFDRTLADSFGAIRSAAHAAFVENGLPPAADADLRGVVGLGLSKAFEQLLPDGDAELISAVVAAYRAAWLQDGSAPIVLFDGVAELLDDLADAGTPMAIATSKGRRGAGQALVSLGLADYFDPVVTFDDVEHGKPEPDMVLLACAARDILPADTVVIGDTSFDIEMGRRAGAATVAVTWGNQPLDQLTAAQPSHVVDTVAELEQVVRQNLAW